MAPEKRADVARAVIPLAGPLSPDGIQAICERVETLVLADGCRQVVCQVSGTTDLSVVDALARVALVIQRSHASLRIEARGEAAASLAELAALTGLEFLDQNRTQLLKPGRQTKTRE